VPVEGVVHALSQLHAALVPGGIVVDTQPLSPRSRVEDARGRLGRLDMRDWRETIDAVDARVAQAIDAGLFAIDGERVVEVPDEFDSGPEFVEVVGGWQGTRIPESIAERAGAVLPPIRVIQDVRLRVLRALV
jgi:hypothetical protein